MQLNAFAVPAADRPTPDLLPTEGGGGGGGGGGHYSASAGHSSTDQPTAGKLAGNFHGSEYNRREENGVGSPGLESALADLHEQLVEREPTLLPLLRKIGNEIHFERTRHLEQRAELLRHVYPATDADVSRNRSSQPHTGKREVLKRGYSAQAQAQAQARGVRGARGAAEPHLKTVPALKRSASLSPPRNTKARGHGRVEGVRGGAAVSSSLSSSSSSSVHSNSNSAFDAMASFQAAKARRAAAEQIRADKLKQQQKSQRVKWDTVGF